MKVRFLSGAEEELDEGFAFYEKREAGLGSEFVDEVWECIHKVKIAPERWPHVTKKAQRARVHRFPYDVIFQQVADGIEVIAVVQLNRKPGYWKKRT